MALVPRVTLKLFDAAKSGVIVDPEVNVSISPTAEFLTVITPFDAIRSRSDCEPPDAVLNISAPFPPSAVVKPARETQRYPCCQHYLYSGTAAC